MIMETFTERLDDLETRIVDACVAAGRERGSVQLVAVSKRKPVEAIREAADAGVDLFGENRVQEALQKMQECASSLRWHLIGPLQSNKMRLAVKAEFELIHSLDSVERLQRLDGICREEGRVQPVLLQINVSGEPSKSGMAAEDLIPALNAAVQLTSLEIQGLMTMPPLTRDPADAAPYFASLRSLRDRAVAETGFPLEELSMGMSRDLDVAIREGATFVRVGTDLFGKRDT